MDEWLPPLVEVSGFFAFKFLEYPGVTNKRPLASWFLAALPGNALVSKWKTEFTKRWRTRRYLTYHEVHLTLHDVLQSDKTAMSIFRSTPNSSQVGPHSCQKRCPEQCVMDAECNGRFAPMFKRPFGHHGPPATWWAAVWNTTGLPPL
eukprot:TRINITY_DN14110_c0_g1_i1.p1 TRINITY_DN14110_c0_g1~~TRINITY_DN14110_c0_g1_i1.p1  ORF type:complete len:148 (+),score=11.57 TRINITY_DN14110_c0_g1_i1:256-699(+)